MSQIAAPVHLFIGFMAIRMLGQGALTLIATTMAATWFIRQRGRVSVLTAFASPVSQATFPILAHGLIAHVGWRQTWVCFAVMVWGILLLPALLLVRRHPEAVGLQPDGDTAPRPATRSAEQQEIASPEEWSLYEAYRTRTFWLLLFSSASASLVSTALTFHHVALFASKGLEPALAAGVLSFMAPMALAGSFVAGVLVDRVANRFVLAAALTLFVLAVIWATLMTSPWQGFLYGGMFGLSQGMSMTVNMVIWPNYFGRSALGSIRGVASTAMVAAAALGPLPFGYAVTLSGSYNVALLTFVTLPVICIATSLLAVAPTRPNRQNTVKHNHLTSDGR
jgi:sugar phosphate permease